MKSRIAQMWVAIIALAGLQGSVHADVVFQTGNIGTGLTDNVIFNGCDAGKILGPATLLRGCLNTDHDQYVDLLGTETLKVAGGGQAAIEANDSDGYNYLKISLTDVTLGFTRIIFNVDAVNRDAGDIKITANLFTPPGGARSQEFTLDTNGQNYFTITSDNSWVIESLVFESVTGVNSVQFADTKQIRLGIANQPGGGGDVCPPGTHGVPPNCIRDQPDPLPEPGMLTLLGVGLLGLMAIRRRWS